MGGRKDRWRDEWRAASSRTHLDGIQRVGDALGAVPWLLLMMLLLLACGELLGLLHLCEAELAGARGRLIALDFLDLSEGVRAQMCEHICVQRLMRVQMRVQ